MRALAPPRRADLVLVLGLTVAVGALSPWFPGIRSGNELSRVYLTEALLVDGTVAIDGPVARHGNTPDKSVFENKTFSDKAPGVALVALPAVALYRAFDSTPTLAGQVRAARIPASVLPTLLMLWLLLGWLREVADASTARAVVVATALGSLTTPYGTLLFGHQLAGVCILAAFLSARRLRGRPAVPDRVIGAVGAGFFAGMAVLTEYPAALLLVPVGVAFAVWTRLRPAALALALAGAAVPVATLLLYHQAAFGHPLHTGYLHIANPYFASLHAEGWLGLGPPRLGLLGFHLFSPRKGLLFFAPWLALAAVGLVALRGAKSRLPSAFSDLPVVLGVVIVWVLVVLSMPYRTGGWTLGQRHFTGLVPWLAWLVAVGLARWPGLRPLFVGLAVAAFAVTGLATAVFPAYPEFGHHPTLQYGLPLAAAGVDGGSLWNGLGLASVEGQTVVLLTATAGLALWLRRRWMVPALAIGAGYLVLIAHLDPGRDPAPQRQTLLQALEPLRAVGSTQRKH